MLCCLFFFQAEDGIRDLVRSRGLGDVYKRQVAERRAKFGWRCPARAASVSESHRPRGLVRGLRAVSYTHLTLPTSDLV